MNPIGGAGVLPGAMARTIMKEGVSSVRKLASSVRNEERLDFVQAVALAAGSADWKERPALSGRGWPLRGLPSDTGLAPVPEKVEEQAERGGIAAARLNGVDTGSSFARAVTGGTRVSRTR